MTARITPFGDRALLLEVDDQPAAHSLASAIERGRRSRRAPVGVGETVVGMASLVVHLDGSTGTEDAVGEWLQELTTGVDSSAPSDPSERSAASGSARGSALRRRVDIPVTFDGPDLDEVAERIGIAPARVADLLTAAHLDVAFLGFAPGFAYLTGLPPELAAVPRRQTPRVSVPAGSVALAGGFASVYPSTGPGGWNLIGRTPIRLFDPEQPPYALLAPGDAVRFTDQRAAEQAGADIGLGPGPGHGPGSEPEPSDPARRSPLTARSARFVEVLDPGLLTLVQDGGRVGVAAVGIPRAGPADPATMSLANRLVGNADTTAAIEVTASGPRLRFAGRAHLAVVAPPGAHLEVLLDGLPLATGSVVPVGDGQVLTVRRVRGGLRAYLAVSGGFDTPVVIGSRSSDQLSGLGPGPLIAADRLDLGPPGRPHGQLLPPASGIPSLHGSGPDHRWWRIRVVAGPHTVSTAGAEPLAGGPWLVGPASNRIGVRLSPRDRPAVAAPGQIPSTGMVTGAVQLPPDGHPIILLPDHATVGGYPVVACVIAADLPLVGQLGPGDTVEFMTVDLETAHAEEVAAWRALGDRVTGWFPTEAAT
jgi:KipI family sensor histidine kinase inhibitor